MVIINIHYDPANDNYSHAAMEGSSHKEVSCDQNIDMCQIKYPMSKKCPTDPTVKFWAMAGHWATGHLEKWASGLLLPRK